MAAAPSAASCSGPSRRPKPTRHLCHMANDILIVDDEADIRMLIAGILEDEGYDARSAANAREALDAIRRRMPSLVILDIWLQNSHLDGIGILDEIQRDHPDLPVVMISGHGTIETADRESTRLNSSH